MVYTAPTNQTHDGQAEHLVGNTRVQDSEGQVRHREEREALRPRDLHHLQDLSNELLFFLLGSFRNLRVSHDFIPFEY